MTTDLVERLSDAAAKKSYDPINDIDWDVPFDLQRFYMPERDLSLAMAPRSTKRCHERKGSGLACMKPRAHWPPASGSRTS